MGFGLGNTMSNATQLEPVLLGAEDAAALLSISKRHFLSLDSSGRIPASIKLGKRRLWSVETLKEWVRSDCPARDAVEQGAEK